MNLSHNSPECTGRWVVRPIEGQIYWRCDRSAAITPATGADHEAVIRETLMGITLGQLTNEGRELLEGA